MKPSSKKLIQVLIRTLNERLFVHIVFRQKIKRCLTVTFLAFNHTINFVIQALNLYFSNSIIPSNNQITNLYVDLYFYTINLFIIELYMNREIKRKQNSDNQQIPKDRSRSRSRSRQKVKHNHQQRQETYLRKINLHEGGESIFKPLQNHQNQTPEQRQKKQIKKELLRSFLRIQQNREQPIDKFVKIVWILKGKFVYDHRIHEIMSEPKKYLEKLNSAQLSKMLQLAQGHRLYEHYEKSPEEEYWMSVIGLLKHLLEKLTEGYQKLEPQYEQRIKQILMKPLADLIKLQKQTIMILKTQTFGSNQEYWKQVLSRIKVKRLQLLLNKFYTKFREENLDKIQRLQDIQEDIHKEPTSPTLVPFSSINPKLIVLQQQQKEAKKKLAQKIFKQQFEKGRQKLEINLSLPQNHGLLSTQIITQQTGTYDQITKEIIEFERYKRMEEDEQDFNDWVPCQTEGRFRETKPIYINRVRVACQWNKYNNLHYTEDNPPPKTIQGYKFNIFYPDLYDKQKTPQYYLETTDDPNYCIIKFKAGPPYKDIAFKILKKQWDITEKSGFESIFAKGILHLYFNFKKPRFRI